MGLSLPNNSILAIQTSAEALLSQAIQSAPQPVTIVALGPLTNLGKLLQANPLLTEDIAMIYAMGGAFEVDGNLSYSGTVTNNTAAEWNIYIDPYAANLTIKSGAWITFVPLDATNQAPLTRDFVSRLGRQQTTPAATFVYQILDRIIQSISSDYYFWDPLAAAIATESRLGSSIEKRVWVIDDEGPQSGATRFDENGFPVRIIKAVDQQSFESLFIQVLNGW